MHFHSKKEEGKKKGFYQKGLAFLFLENSAYISLARIMSHGHSQVQESLENGWFAASCTPH